MNNPELPIPPDKDLRQWIVEKVLEFHKGNNTDNKRIITDCETLYVFITNFIK